MPEFIVNGKPIWKGWLAGLSTSRTKRGLALVFPLMVTFGVLPMFTLGTDPIFTVPETGRGVFVTMTRSGPGAPETGRTRISAQGRDENSKPEGDEKEFTEFFSQRVSCYLISRTVMKSVAETRHSFVQPRSWLTRMPATAAV